MTENIDIEDLLQVFATQEDQQSSQDILEQVLLQLILNPSKVLKQRIRVQDDLGEGILFEIREGSRINEYGVQEEIEELVINTSCFGDGSPMNIYGIGRCPNCGLLVKEDSLRICQFCGKLHCIAKGCGRYSILTRKWFCCRTHRFLGLFGVSLR